MFVGVVNIINNKQRFFFAKKSKTIYLEKVRWQTAQFQRTMHHSMRLNL